MLNWPAYFPAEGLEEETWPSNTDVAMYHRERCLVIQPLPRFRISMCAEPIVVAVTCGNKPVLALDLEGVHDVKLHHPSSSAVSYTHLTLPTIYSV